MRPGPSQAQSAAAGVVSPTQNHDPPLLTTPLDSYARRRELFKEIWCTAMKVQNEDKKPKVIKTARLEEINRCPVGKTKAQRIKDLRHVCNRILEFCNQHENKDNKHTKKAMKTMDTVKAVSSSTSVKPLKRQTIKKTFAKKKLITRPKSAVVPTSVTIGASLVKPPKFKSTENTMIGAAKRPMPKPKPPKVASKPNAPSQSQDINYLPSYEFAKEATTKHRTLKKKKGKKKIKARY